MHTIVGELMYAENFYIALYDPVRDALNYPYNVDTADPDVLDPKAWDQMGATRLARGTTAYVLRTGRPAHIDLERFHELEEAGEVDAVGRSVTSVIGWGPRWSPMGGPSARSSSSRTRPSTAYAADLDLLAFVGQHIAIGAQPGTRDRGDARA